MKNNTMWIVVAILAFFLLFSKKKTTTTAATTGSTNANSAGSNGWASVITNLGSTLIGQFAGGQSVQYGPNNTVQSNATGTDTTSIVIEPTVSDDNGGGPGGEND
jgi:threonine/homoserine efflux transporter RhtA